MTSRGNQEEEEEEITDEDIYNDELNTLQKQTGKYVMVTQSWEPDEATEDDEDAEPTLAQLRALPVILLPKRTSHFMESKYKELDSEVDGLFMLNTASSDIMMDFFNKEMKAIKRNLSKDPQEAMARAVAVSSLMIDYPTWFHDTESPGDAKDTLLAYQDMWKTILSTKSDAELGLSAPAGQNARANLLAWIKKLKELTNEASYDL